MLMLYAPDIRCPGALAIIHTLRYYETLQARTAACRGGAVQRQRRAHQSDRPSAIAGVVAERLQSRLGVLCYAPYAIASRRFLPHRYLPYEADREQACRERLRRQFYARVFPPFHTLFVAAPSSQSQIRHFGRARRYA